LSPVQKASKLLIFIVFTPSPKGRTLKISSLEKSPLGDLGVKGLFRLGTYLLLVLNHEKVKRMQTQLILSPIRIETKPYLGRNGSEDNRE
jgi:hypothetical protein